MSCQFHADGLTNNPYMSNKKPDLQIEIHYTADGSPTLSFNGGEKMHSMDGALSESLYIYGSCIEKTLNIEKPTILSMGLGLGYNELIGIGLLANAKKKDFFILSLDKENWLIDNLKNYIKYSVEKSKVNEDSNNNHDIKSQSNNQIAQDAPLIKTLYNCYDLIVSQVANALKIIPKDLIQLTWDALESGNLQISGDVKDIKSQEKFNAILYDAFSGKTDQYLWSSNHLINFISTFCDENICYFTTYAATGDLGRSLKSSGFEVIKQKGYGKKRESTFALRISK
jgi:hypothetical protein